MSEYYDHYHRWEPLAEFHFNLNSDDEEFDEENYVYCLCSRAFIRDGVRTYYVDKEDGSESDMEVQRDSGSQDWEDQSHVHFSLDTSYKVKCERDEGASCYCSASHTDNCCSTDEHEAAQIHGVSHALQPSDSGADLTYQDCHSDYTNQDKLERMDQDLIHVEENYLSENTWDKFWAINGERLIWASWIKKYSDYINPAYLDENNDLVMDDNNIPKQKSVDQIFKVNEQKNNSDDMRERKFSYDSKVNPYKKRQNQEKQEKVENKDESWLPVSRRRSCSEHERIVSPRTLAGTDSMTNVTKITMSSYDMSSSHVTSESTPTDDYSVSSTTSDDQSNDQTRIANVEIEQPAEEMDTEQYWQYLWKKHFGEQYALHYANYLDTYNNSQNKDVPDILVDTVEMDNDKEPEEKTLEVDSKQQDKALEIECENSEGNSQDMPTVIEVQSQIEVISLEEKTEKPKKRGKKKSNKYLDSVGFLLQNLLKDEQFVKENSETETKKEKENTEVVDAGDENQKQEQDTNENRNTELSNENNTTLQKPMNSNNFTSYSYDDGDDDPPDEIPINLKRSHELDDEEMVAEKIKSTFEIMGFCIKDNKMPKGSMVYRKRLARLRPPRYRRFGGPKKTYFDEEGYPIQDHQRDDDEKEMQTDDDVADKEKEISTQTHPNTETHLNHENENTCTNTAITHTNMDLKNAEVDLDATVTRTDTAEKTVNLQTCAEAKDLSTIQVPSGTELCTVENKTDDAVDDSEALLEAAAVPLPSDLDQSTDQDLDKYDDNVGNVIESAKRRRRQKKKKIDVEAAILSELPAELQDDPRMMKYWKKRHSLFHRFDEGIQLDRESWFSVTPENVARHIACKYTYDTVLDAFCGAGGNTIQFAKTSNKVIAIDIDPVKIEMAKHNAAVYGVSDRIQFIVGDFFQLADNLEADMVFLSPPWGGPNYSNNAQYDIETMLEPRPASELMAVARTISPNITLYLPRNSNPNQILSLAKDVSGSVEVEQSYLDKRFVAITAYYY